MDIKNPEIQKHFVISVTHVTSNDLMLLDNTGTEGVLPVDKFEYGYRVYIHITEPDELEGEAEAFKTIGYSAAFYNIVTLARKAGCEFLSLDCDGSVYPELPSFDEDVKVETLQEHLERLLSECKHHVLVEDLRDLVLGTLDLEKFKANWQQAYDSYVQELKE